MVDTQLNDSLFEGLKKVQTGRNAKKVILVVTDGADAGSRHKFSEVQNILKNSDVLLYILNLYSVDGSLGMDTM